MRFSWVVIIALIFAVTTAECKRKRKFDGDFEFAEEVSFKYHIISYINNYFIVYSVLVGKKNHLRLSIFFYFYFLFLQSFVAYLLYLTRRGGGTNKRIPPLLRRINKRAFLLNFYTLSFVYFYFYSLFLCSVQNIFLKQDFEFKIRMTV